MAGQKSIYSKPGSSGWINVIEIASDPRLDADHPTNGVPIPRLFTHSARFAEYVAADTGFHEALASATHNSFLAGAINHLHTHYRLAHLYRNHGVIDAAAALREHKAITGAVAAKRPHDAGDLMQEHILRSRDHLRIWVKTQ